MSIIKKAIFGGIGVVSAFFSIGSSKVIAATLENPLQVGSITELLSAVLDIIAQIALPIVVLAIIYTGFLFVKAQGNEEKLAEAKKALLWTVVGAIVLLGASVFSSAIEGTVESIKSGFLRILVA